MILTYSVWECMMDFQRNTKEKKENKQCVCVREREDKEREREGGKSVIRNILLPLNISLTIYLSELNIIFKSFPEDNLVLLPHHLYTISLLE